MNFFRQTVGATLFTAIFATTSIPAGAAEPPGAPSKKSASTASQFAIATGNVDDAWFHKSGVDVALNPLPSFCNFGSRYMSAIDPTVVDTLRDLLVIQRAAKVTVYVEVQNSWCYITQVDAITNTK